MTLKDIIAQSIRDNNGAIGFDAFMDFALYTPARGYYRRGETIFGEQGDFITAPETSDLFGYCLAKQCRSIINDGGNILEFGAGTGILAAQILFELARLGSLPEQYFILELSGQLQQKQKETISRILPELVERVQWLSELPSDFSGVVIANEVLDAMPAKRVRYRKGEFFELAVAIEQGSFQWKVQDQPFSSSLTPLPSVCVEGYTTEINQQALAWVDSLYQTMSDGLVLLIDYGMARSEYHHEQRTEGTLRCYHQHKASDNPFENIGQQDITTSVNFSDIAEQALESGFVIAGYCTQAMFLISLGIDQYLLDEKDLDRRSILAQQVKQLVLPSAMGESFKVLALTKQQSVKLDGFKEQNLVNKL
ncbi:MAG: SAM-dependent methyltransferase [Gammaproteobacteria bacterium]